MSAFLGGGKWLLGGSSALRDRTTGRAAEQQARSEPSMGILNSQSPERWKYSEISLEQQLHAIASLIFRHI